MSIRLGIGIDVFSSGISAEASAFRTRVLADGGTFESINCLQTTVTNLKNININ
jgi:hypothetical protein